ncbi:2,3-bisphosphoglycerate-independent phosphoglycerate mutase [Alkaliphilus hydrothermalis]|uniref:2,3-bisphosphoglycerate-independent phosphoglycerate mutase n=1 Tax=Alkaliphilus hydrothermalis TaxID=1482730 RepID=A0ABS2NN74_9FIRM|nr:2,3-bisphosphoglycerate-independent phosphoglycerate mutase [Alkaliphilus hydrothermalis]MBM7614359.1 2,3-bisphosphoglycerate-independent phosphoglycerate mutase [Alkaliphilus hydrothermalis]
MKKSVALVILDGFGINNQTLGNAVKAAKLPNYHSLINQYPSMNIQASGMAVGLPEGQMGNSEVGHLNIGAGRIVYQELTRISREIQLGNFFENPALVNAMEHAKNNKTQLHLMGLVSDGGVHSHIKHLYALLKMAKRIGVEDVLIHCFLDGRDTPPQSALQYIEELRNALLEIGVGRIASISGRYYAMDRDLRWERTKSAYDAIVMGQGVMMKDPLEAIKASYNIDELDEFVKPVVIPQDGQVHNVNNGDSVIFFNFRPDRARQMTRALIEDEFDGFVRVKGKLALHYVSMTLYDASIKGVNIAYPPQTLNNTLGQYLSQNNIKQFRIAETEKYAHVTYFFNGGVEEAYPNEDRRLIQSPKVATYDLKPEMSAQEVTDTLIKEIDGDKYDFIVVNYANPDMVGHTGVFDAVVRALDTVDNCLGQVIDKILSKGGAAIVTSDHGNAEALIDEVTGGPVTAHTTNPVPLVLVTAEKHQLVDEGKLCDIAPTILELLGINKPLEMTGESLIKKQ